LGPGVGPEVDPVVDLEGDHDLTGLEVGLDAGDLTHGNAGHAHVVAALHATGVGEHGRQLVAVLEDVDGAQAEGEGHEAAEHHDGDHAQAQLVDVAPRRHVQTVEEVPHWPRIPRRSS